jgi:tRNA nucleotidyltransferase/poly(A) polymerase
VRDALLEAAGARARRGSDLDVSAPATVAEAFAAALAARLGTRAIAVGPPRKRVLRLPLPGREVDVFETVGSPDEDLLRRDFTVNAMTFDLGTGAFEAPAAALADLRARRLDLPRPGVLGEDPLRVLRAARFLAELPGFRLAPGAARGMRSAARALRAVAAERRLHELDRLLSAPPAAAAAALGVLERTSALEALLPRSTAPERRQGVRLVRRMSRPSPPVARALLLVPLGWARAEEILRTWKAPRKERQLARRLFAVAQAIGTRPPSKPSVRREVVEMIRGVAPFFDEAVLFFSAFADARSRRLASALLSLSRDRSRRARLLRPPRPIAVHEVASLLGVSSGPELGRALAALDLAVAAGKVRSRSGALRLLADAGKAPPRRAPR